MVSSCSTSVWRRPPAMPPTAATGRAPHATRHRRRHAAVRRPRTAAGRGSRHPHGPVRAGRHPLRDARRQRRRSRAPAVEVFHAILYEQPPCSPADLRSRRSIASSIARWRRKRPIVIRPPRRWPRTCAPRSRSAIPARGASAKALTRLIVLPFRILRPDPETDFLAFSLADAVTSSLSGLQSLVVRSSAAAARFAGRAGPEGHRAGSGSGRGAARHADACRRPGPRHVAAGRRVAARP